MAEGKAETAPTIFDRRIQMAPADPEDSV